MSVTSPLDVLLGDRPADAPGRRWVDDHGWPQVRDEAWRYAPLAAIAGALDGAGGPGGETAGDVERLLEGLPEGPKVVVVDGRYREDLSSFTPDGRLEVTFDAAVGEFRPDGIDDGFAAANHAANPGTTRIEVTGDVGDVALHLVQLSVTAVASHPRTEVVVAPGASVQLVETFRATPGGLTNSVTVLDLGTGARVDHLRVLRSATDAAHVGRSDLILHDDATVHSSALSAGPGAARHTVSADLAGDGATVKLSGLSAPLRGAHHDTAVSVRHRSSGGTSRQQYVAIVPDGGRASFTGQVIVASGTKGTDADQQNRNLLLGRTARADTRPWLQIDADDVSCTHGATVGRLDDDSLFYLRSRGIPERDARAMLIRAFAETTLDQDFPPGLGRDWLTGAAAAAIDAVLDDDDAATAGKEHP